MAMNSDDGTDPETPMFQSEASCMNESDEHEGESTEWKGWPTHLSKIPDSWAHRPTPPLNDPIWNAVASLFAASWFRRAWIIQETVVAARIQLISGDWVVMWDDLFRAMEIVDSEFGKSRNDFSKLRSNWEPFMCLASQREWEARESRWPLFMLLETFRHAQSTLCRDRIYALLGLASDGDNAAFKPDYESRLEDILQRVACEFVRQGKGMQMLYYAGLSGPRFPSWIPDWTVQRPSSLSENVGSGKLFLASGLQEPEMEFNSETAQLAVGGYRIDIITSISESSNVEDEWRDYFEEVDAMIDSSGEEHLLSSAVELKWKVPIAGAEYPHITVTDCVSMEESYKSLRAYLGERQSAHDTHITSPDITISRRDNNHTSLPKDAMSYTAALNNDIKRWRFIITEGGLAGVVPHGAQKGDTIVILKGGSVPFILRPAAGYTQSFQLIGEAYIYGLMNGEGLYVPTSIEETFCIQ
ncbi:hypothetical protein ACHAO9_007995 [Fusarium lateritium]